MVRKRGTEVFRGIDYYNTPEEAKYGDTFEMKGDLSPRSFFWWSGDNEKRWEENKELEQMVVWHDSLPGGSNPLTYDINSHGFRTKELDSFDSDSIMILGCSMTFGVGVHEESTYAHQLSKYLDAPIINLGYPGGSLDAIYRIYSYWQPKIKSKVTIILIPPGRRFESAANDEYRFWYKWGIHNMTAMKEEGGSRAFLADKLTHNFFEDHQVAVNMQRNLNAIRYIAKETKSELYIFDAELVRNEPTWVKHSKAIQIVPEDIARDNNHPGPVWHKKTAMIIAENF